MEPRWFVVRKREVDPVEVFTFTDEESAREFYDRVSWQWIECYLCKIVEPIR